MTPTLDTMLAEAHFEMLVEDEAMGDHGLNILSDFAQI
jgi:hypothetical protein